MIMQKLETSDERIGLKFIVGANGNYARISVGKLGDNFNVSDEVYVLTASEHKNVLSKINDADKYIAKINQLQDEIDNNDIKALNKQLAVYEKQVDKLTKSNNAFKQWNDEYKAKNEDLEHKLDKYKQTIADKDATILRLKQDNETDHETRRMKNVFKRAFHAFSSLIKLRCLDARVNKRIDDIQHKGCKEHHDGNDQCRR